MKIVLTHDEIKEALVDAAQKKVSEVLQFDVDNCYFDNVHIEGIEGADHTVEQIEFVCCD